MIDIDFFHHEINQLADDLSQAAVRGVRRTRSAVEDIMNHTVAEARTLAPMRTGRLRASITGDLDADGLGFIAGPMARYGHFVEFGTHDDDGGTRMSPEPYMLPAFDHQVEVGISQLELLMARIFDREPG